MEYRFNRSTSENRIDADDVIRHEIYGDDAIDTEFDSYDEYSGKIAPTGGIVSRTQRKHNCISDEDVQRLRGWNEQNKL